MIYHYLLRIAYNGKLFHGVVPQPGVKTVLGELFNVIGKPINFSIVSRTDKGVSARENYLSFSISKKINIDEINIEGVRILKAFELKEYINIRKFAIEKEYWYKIPKNLTGNEWFIFKPKYIIIDDYKIKVEGKKQDFNLKFVEKALNELTGKHDFKNFAKGSVNNRYCRIIKAFIEDEENHYLLKIVGNRFLYEMVRKLVSFLLSIGFGLFPLEHIKLVLERGILDPKPPSAPPENLLLYRISLDWIKIYKYIKDVLI